MGMGAAQNTETVLYGKVCGLGVEDLSLQGTKCAGHDVIITHSNQRDRSSYRTLLHKLRNLFIYLFIFFLQIRTR